MRALPFAIVTLLGAFDTAVRSQQANELPTVMAPPAGRTVEAMRNFSQGFTADDRGSLWCLVLERDAQNHDALDLWLCRSDDLGRAWQRVTAVPTPGASFGALAGERAAPRLSVAWSAPLHAGEPTSALFQVFDTEHERWLDAPQVLEQGTGDEDQFGVSDCALAADGTAVVLVTTHRQPVQAVWPSGWSTGVMLRARGADAWAGPFPVNTAAYAVYGNLQLFDGHAHTTFRSTAQHSRIAWRSLALGTQRFDQPHDVEVSVAPDSGRLVSNASSLLLGPDGERTVLYPGGQQDSDRGALLIAFAAGGAHDDAWHHEVLCEDPALRSGNVRHEQFALVRGPGAQAIALYAKVGERCRVLYRRVIEGGRAIGPEQVVAESDLDFAFTRICAQRDARFTTGLLAVVSGDGAGGAPGVRAVLAKAKLPTRWQ